VASDRLLLTTPRDNNIKNNEHTHCHNNKYKIETKTMDNNKCIQYTINDNKSIELDKAIMEIDKYRLNTDQDYVNKVNENIINIINQSIEAVMQEDNNSAYTLHTVCGIKHLEKVLLHLIDIFPQAVHKKSHKPYPYTYNCRYPIVLAIRNNLSENVILRLIDEFPQIIHQETVCSTMPYLLHLACAFHQSETVTLRILEEFPDAVMKRDKDGNYPLHLALFYNQSEEVVLTLINKYRIAVAKTDRDESIYPLRIALRNNHTERVVRQLIKVFSQAIQVPDQGGYYPLSDAFNSNCSNNIVLQLLYAFPQVARESSSLSRGYPLLNAFKSKQSDRIVLILLNYNLFAVTSVQDDGRSPLDVAKANGYSEQIIDVLETLMNKTYNELENCINIPKIVLSHTVDNLLRYDTIQWLLWNTPVKIKGQYILQSTLLFPVEKTTI
jgi:hypothetical protein